MDLLTSVLQRPIYILGLTFQLPMGPPGLYLTLTLRELGFSTFQSNLLSIPYTIGHSTSPFFSKKTVILLTMGSVIMMLLITYTGEVIKELTFVSMSSQIWALPILIFLNVTDLQEIDKWVLYGILIVLLMYPNRMLPSLSKACLVLQDYS